MEAGSQLHILVAEDDPADRFLVKKGLEESGLFSRIDCVKNGEELILYLEETAELPDLILSDLKMPKIDGLEALKSVKSMPRLSSIPFVLFSTSNYINDMESARQLGAAEYIIKPSEYSGYVRLGPSLMKIVNSLRS